MHSIIASYCTLYLCLCCFLISSISFAKPITTLSLLNADLNQYYTHSRNNNNYDSDQLQYSTEDDSQATVQSQSPETYEQIESRVLYYKVSQSSDVDSDPFDAIENNNPYAFETYGPFPEEQVLDWWRAGYFDSSLLVSDDLANPFIPMTTFLEEGFSSTKSTHPLSSLPSLSATRPSDAADEREGIQNYDAAGDEPMDWPSTSTSTSSAAAATTKIKKKKKKRSSVLKKIAGLGRRAKEASLAFLQDTLTSPSRQSDPDTAGEGDEAALFSAAPPPCPAPAPPSAPAGQPELLAEAEHGQDRHRQQVSERSNVRGAMFLNQGHDDDDGDDDHDDVCMCVSRMLPALPASISRCS